MTDDARELRRRRRAEVAFHALGEHHGNVKEAAQSRGMAESTFRRWVSVYCEINGYETPFEAAWHRNLSISPDLVESNQ